MIIYPEGTAVKTMPRDVSPENLFLWTLGIAATQTPPSFLGGLVVIEFKATNCRQSRFTRDPSRVGVELPQLGKDGADR